MSDTLVRTTEVDAVKPTAGNVAAARALLVAVALAAVGMLLGPPAALEAQDDDTAPEAGTVSFDPRAGVAVPLADLDEILQTGASIGGGVAIHLSRQVALRADAEYQMFTGARTPSPENLLFADVNSLNLTGGLDIHFLDPETRWTGSLSLGAGISTLETDETTDDGDPAPVSADLTNLALRTGTKLGYAATDQIDIYLEPAVYLSVLERDETRPFAAMSDHVTPFDVAWVLPIQAGVRIRLR